MSHKDGEHQAWKLLLKQEFIAASAADGYHIALMLIEHGIEPKDIADILDQKVDKEVAQKPRVDENRIKPRKS